MMKSIPTATYRLQLTADFTFDDAAAIVPYLKSIGISHVYASPFMKARRGSTHGYDIVDHAVLNPELGGEDGFERLSVALQAADLGLILDFVPNHMGVHFADNEAWLDVLEWGAASPYAASFDIAWDTLPYRSKGGVLLPIIGTSYGEALAKGDIELRYDHITGSFSAWYFEHRLPIAPERYSDILRTVVTTAGAQDSDAGRELLRLASLHKGLKKPARADAPAFKAAICGASGGAAIIAKGLEAFRAGNDRGTQTLALHHLLDRQHYRLAHWRLATSEINYRRFFDVNSLAGLRVEDRDTFDRIHALVKRLIAQGKLQGLRLDHIDGLRDPAQYFTRLRTLIRDAQGANPKPFYLLIEKILGEGESLPRFAGVHGTTGYEWLNVMTQVLVDSAGLDDLDEVWRQASNISPKFEPLLLEAKRRVLETLLASEFIVLNRMLSRIAAGHYTTRDYSGDSLRQAFELFVLHFPVYRTYITPSGPTPNDRQLINTTIDRARQDWFGADEGIFDFLRDALTLDLLQPGRPPTSRDRVRRFAFKVQQFTGPTMAKSLEDTAFYRYHRLLALNEVGGDPAAKGLSIADFHTAMALRAKQWPHGMTATATHDTKRGEDARARILALAEMPGEWASVVGKWKSLNAPLVATKGNLRSPSLADEYMLYQALIGALPIGEHDDDFVPRMQAYATKAIREAKLQTSWLNPNEFYESSVSGFIEAILDPVKSGEFLDSLKTFARRTSLLGALNSLSQMTLKSMMPGVPDFYQGTEMWDFSLVDPDNRRPVDFGERSKLSDTTSDNWSDLVRTGNDGKLKFAWTKHLIKSRLDLPALFTAGDYQPLRVTGPDSDRVIAFARGLGQDAVIVLVLRHLATLSDGGRTWPDFARLDGAVDVSGFTLTDPRSANAVHQLPLADAFAHGLPVAVLRATRSKATGKTKATGTAVASS